MWNKLLTLIVMSGAALLIGCDKKVTLRFTNLTPEPRQVELSGPYGPRYAGTVAPDGGKLPVSVKIKKDDLPADLQWRAGDVGGTVTITNKTEKDLWVDIRRDGPPRVRGKDDEVRETRQTEIRDRVVEQGTIVE